MSSPTVVPIDEYATGEWYPGYKPEHFATSYLVDPASPFKPGDDTQFKAVICRGVLKDVDARDKRGMTAETL